MFLPRLRRTAALIGSAVLGLSLAVATHTPQAGALALVSVTHPFSNPIWYPIHAKSYLDCVLSNPGCAGTHSDWTMDMVRETLPRGTEEGDLGVYAMGAGRLFYGDPRGRPCDDSHTATFGTWVWLDHGGGVVSKYGHLASIALPSGTLVRAGQRIGTMGTTGKGGNCEVPYVDFAVRHHGIGGPRIQIRTLRACVGEKYQVWPRDLNATDHWRAAAPKFPKPTHDVYYQVWNDVPQRSVDFPATTHDCLPDTPPDTPVAPSGVSVSRSGSGQLTVRWNHAPDNAGTVQLRLSEFHSSVNHWDYTQHETYVNVGPAQTSHEFGGLINGHRYRIMVTFGNSIGWGRSSGWFPGSPAVAPSTPQFRDLFVSGADTANIHYKWYMARANGVPVTKYRVQLRRVLRTGYGRWVSAATTNYSYVWYSMRRRAAYQLRVQALSSMGPSPFLYTRTRT